MKEGAPQRTRVKVRWEKSDRQAERFELWRQRLEDAGSVTTGMAHDF